MANKETSPSIPMFKLGGNGGVILPVVGLGLGPNPRVPDHVTIEAVLDAVEVGYRHFDTAPIYLTETGLGEGIAMSIERGMLARREDFCVSSKLWCTDAHPNLVLPALKASLQKLKLDYLDLYLIHWPVSGKPAPPRYPLNEEEFLPTFDLHGVWAAMEECQRLGLTKAIGVCNFTPKTLEQLLSVAKIPPAVIQVEVNPIWQQKELIKFCKTKGISVMAHSPLGGPLEGNKSVMQSDVLMDIAKAKEKTVAQIALRWAYEQGVVIVVSSYIKEWMKENIDIFDWELSLEDHKKIDSIPQGRTLTGWDYTSKFGPFQTIEQIWDGDV